MAFVIVFTLRGLRTCAFQKMPRLFEIHCIDGSFIQARAHGRTVGGIGAIVCVTAKLLLSKYGFAFCLILRRSRLWRTSLWHCEKHLQCWWSEVVLLFGRFYRLLGLMIDPTSFKTTRVGHKIWISRCVWGVLPDSYFLGSIMWWCSSCRVNSVMISTPVAQCCGLCKSSVDYCPDCLLLLASIIRQPCWMVRPVPLLSGLKRLQSVAFQPSCDFSLPVIVPSLTSVPILVLVFPLAVSLFRYWHDWELVYRTTGSIISLMGIVWTMPLHTWRFNVQPR